MFEVHYTLLGVPFQKVQRTTIVEAFQSMLEENRFHMVATPNPEFMLVTLDNPYYRTVLASADLNIVDGFGLLWASTFWEETRSMHSRGAVILKALVLYLYQIFAKKRLQKYLPETVLGSDTFFALHPYFAEQGTRVFYFGGENGAAEETKQVMEKKYPSLRIVGTSEGYPYRSKEENDEILAKIIKARPEVLFVALQFPKQEMWMYEHREILEKAGVKIAMGIGGTYNFAIGRIKRAPILFQRMRLEWLWRLINEPSRYKRIFRAVVYFPYRVVQERLKTL